ncbi:MAG TPA: hypothetical protein VFN03_06655, partial [Trueperaceae bacterium]|nr:hypothetical protein [Trueperaceae bacterium]
DSQLAATPLGPSGTVAGEFQGRDTDVFKVTVTGEAALYGFRLESAANEWLRLMDTEGATIAETRGTGTLRLDDLQLMPGDHYVAVRGSDVQYDLVAAPVALVPPAGILEIEPNDDVSRAIRLQPGATHVGRLTGGSDDYYRFHLADDQYVRIAITPPAAAPGVRAYVDNAGWSEPFDDDGATVTVVERYFLAGDHSLYLRAPDQGGDGYYQLTMTMLGTLLPPVDAEPNDTREQARPLPAELAFSGRVGQNSGDYDMFRLPRFDAPTVVTVHATGVTGNFNVDFPSAVSISASSRGNAAEGQPWVAELPADTDVWLRLTGSTAYDLRVEFNATPDPSYLLPPRSGAELSVTLSAPADAVAAFWHEGQAVELTASVHNAGTTAQTVALQTGSSHAAVALQGAASVAVGPGQTVDVPVTAMVPSDMRDDLPLRLEVAAIGAGDAAAASVTLAAFCDAPPVSPFTYWPLPPSLLSRPNVLWSGFGVTPPEGSNFVNRDLALIDGRTGPATAGYLGPENRPTYRLAGDAPVTLLGTILNPQVGNDVDAQLRRFRIETSLDRVTFTTALEGELKSARIEQAFEFEPPITARYARLSAIDSHGGRDNGYVGEWKLIAAEFPLQSANLADPAVGGHVAWSTPFVAQHGVSLLTPGDSPRSVDVRETGRMEFVVGFHNGRAGQVMGLEWLDSQGVSPRNEQEQVAGVVAVAVSMGGAAGPWVALPDWDLERDSAGRASVTFDEPVWARYVRLTVVPNEGVRHVYLPDAVSVFERAPGPDYPSLLGEYGNASRAASYEYLNPQTGSSAAAAPDAADTRQAATALASGATAHGTVTVAEDVDWYRLTIPAGENHLAVRLAGDPQIGYRYELQDAAGTRLDTEERSDGDSVVLTYFGSPGDYYLLIEEPKRTVVFNWDTSGSVSPYLPITYNSLARFAADVSSDREAVQLLAFDDPSPQWLLPFWSSDTLRVQRAIVEFDRQADSSNSESSLLVATKALADREGTRAILLMTDAESGTENLTPELWQAFGDVMPRIFTFEISTSGTDYAQDLMQDWADVNGGVYTLASGVGDFDAGFSRASCILRRAKAYRVDVTASYVEPPGPGTLSVTRAAGAAQAAVEIIFDASGSMGRELPSGEQRITAAKRALQSLVGEVLPEGTPFALRAFGHIAPSSCETRLDVTLAPLDRAKAAAAVAAIEPKLLSQTPLADSLTAVAGDLANATAGRTVILITDGVESCKGDPAAAVAALRAGGLDFDLAIVSLALEPDALAAFQSLADSVGASYVDVTSFEELKASIDEALNPAFEVVDASGAVVARGRVGGEGVQLPMGTYTVRVLGAGVEEHTGVRVPGDTLVTLSVGGN